MLSAIGVLLGTAAAFQLFGIKLGAIVFVLLLVAAAMVVLLVFLLTPRGSRKK